MKKLPEITRIPIHQDAEFEVELSREDVEVKWIRDEEIVKETKKYKIIKEKNLRKLVVKDCVHEDEVEYTCLAEEIKTSSQLKVEGKNLWKKIFFSVYIKTQVLILITFIIKNGF